MSSSAPRRLRQERTRANDEAILDAAVEQICARGVDALSMREVAAAAGLTSGATYARYENPAELAVAVWERRSATPFAALLFDALELLDRDDEALLRSVAGRIREPEPAIRAGVEILAVSHRIDELAELSEVAVPGMLVAIEQRGLARDTDASGRALRVGLAGEILGGLLFAIVPGMRPAEWGRVLRWHALATRVPFDPPSGPPVAAVAGEIQVRTGDPLRDRIIEAVGAVVARSGFERATISRVARRAGCGVAAIYDRYPSRTALLEDATRELLASLDRTSVMRYPEIATGRYDEAAAVLANNVAPGNAARRRLRLEIHVAAAHDPGIAAALVAAESDAAAGAGEGLAGQAGIDAGEAVATWVDAARIGSRGMSLLAELLHDLHEVDFRWLTRPILAAGLATLAAAGVPARSGT